MTIMTSGPSLHGKQIGRQWKQGQSLFWGTPKLDCEESWAPKNWCFWTVVLEKTLESPLDCREIQPVHSKGDQPCVFFGRNDAKLLRNLYAGQEATVRTGHGRTDWFQIGKGVRQGCILSPCLFNLYAEYIMRNAGLEGAQAGIKIAGEISITSDMQMTPPLWQKVKN